NALNGCFAFTGKPSFLWSVPSTNQNAKVARGTPCCWKAGLRFAPWMKSDAALTTAWKSMVSGWPTLPSLALKAASSSPLKFSSCFFWAARMPLNSALRGSSGLNGFSRKSDQCGSAFRLRLVWRGFWGMASGMRVSGLCGTRARLLGRVGVCQDETGAAVRAGDLGAVAGDGSGVGDPDRGSAGAAHREPPGSHDDAVGGTPPPQGAGVVGSRAGLGRCGGRFVGGPHAFVESAELEVDAGGREAGGGEPVPEAVFGEEGEGGEAVVGGGGGEALADLLGDELGAGGEGFALVSGGPGHGVLDGQGGQPLGLRVHWSALRHLHQSHSGST